MHVSEGAASLCLVALLALFPAASRAQSIREISLASERWSVCSSTLISSERFVVSSYATLSLEFKLRQWESRQGEKGVRRGAVRFIIMQCKKGFVGYETMQTCA